MTDLYLIRHGQADGLKTGINGSVVPNSGLSPLGIRQAQQLRDRLAKTSEIRADVLISSPLLRAKETAEIIAPALGLPVIVDDGIQEFNLAETEGLTKEEITERFGWNYLDEEPFRRISPNGDSLAEFTMRACNALDRITREYQDKTIVIVVHGGILNATFIYFMGLSLLKPPPIRLVSHNTAITHWHRSRFDDYGRQRPTWCLRRYDDHAHLQGLD